jgi:hypothetical protein
MDSMREMDTDLLDAFLDKIESNERYSPDKKSILYNTLAPLLPPIIAQAERKNVDDGVFCRQAERIDQLYDGIRGVDWGDGTPRRGPNTP